MLTFVFLKFALTTYVKIMANSTGQFLKVEDQGEIRFVQRNEDATLWEISSSIIDRSNSNIRVFGRDAFLSVINGMVSVRPTQKSPMQDFKIVIDDNNNFQIVFNKLNFLDADSDHLFLRNDTSVPLGFTFLVKKFNEKQPKETTDVIENDSLGNTVGKGMAIPVTDHQRAFNLYTLPTLSQETGIDYSNFKKNQDLDPNDLVVNPEFLKNPEEFLNNYFSPAKAEDLKNKYKSAIYYLNANKNDLNPCVQRNALKRMLEADRNKNCDEYGCYEDLEETSSEYIDEECCHIPKYYPFSLAQAMKNKIDWDSRIKRLQLMAQEQERQKKEEKNKDSNIRRDFIQDEEKRVQELNRKAPLEKTHLQGPSDFLRRIIGKRLSGYNIDDDPEISKVLKKGTADPKLRGVTDNKLLYAYNEEEVQKNPEEDRMKICQKYPKPLPKILNEDDLRMYECPDLLYI